VTRLPEKNLDKVTKLQLINAANQLDRSIDGSFSTSGDAIKGTATFSTKDLQAANGNLYLVYAVNKEGVPSATTARLSLPVGPIAWDVTPTTFDLSKVPTSIKLSAYHLDQLKPNLSLERHGSIRTFVKRCGRGERNRTDFQD
jgi:hypothetical protein